MQNSTNLHVKSFLSFKLSTETYGIPLLQAKEVIAYTTTTPIHGTPNYFKGVLNLRGQVISIIDLRVKMNIQKPEFGPETSIIILDIDSHHIGVVVDEIQSVLTISDTEISEAPKVAAKTPNAGITGVAKVDKQLVLLLDLRLTVDLEQINNLKPSTQKTA